jgi:hypothetical protein
VLRLRRLGRKPVRPRGSQRSGQAQGRASCGRPPLAGRGQRGRPFLCHQHTADLRDGPADRALGGSPYLDVIHDTPGEWNPTDYAYHLTRRARGLPLWFSLSVYGVDAYTEAIETAIGLARQTAAEIRRRDNLELIREPELGIVLFRRRGWGPAQYTRWADQLLDDQVAFIPPSAWEGETVARFAFLHPHTSMELVRQILDRMD